MQVFTKVASRSLAWSLSFTRGFYRMVSSLALALVLGLLSHSPAKAADPSKIIVGELGGLKVHSYKHMYFGGQPSATDLAAAAQAGLVAVVNLRRPDEPITPEQFDVKATAEKLGLDYYNVPLYTADKKLMMGNLDELERIHKIFKEQKKHLIYCASGNRAASWFAYHLIIKHDTPVGEAIEFARQLGMSSEAGLEPQIRAFAKTRS